MKRALTLSLLILLVVAGFNLGLAHQTMGEKEVPRQEEKENYQERLNLSVKQAEDIELLQDNYRKEKEGIKDDLRAKRVEFKKKYLDKNLDSKELTVLQEEIIYLKNKLSRLRNEYRLALRDILSEEQLKEEANEWKRRKGSCSKERRD